MGKGEVFVNPLSMVVTKQQNDGSSYHRSYPDGRGGDSVGGCAFRYWHSNIQGLYNITPAEERIDADKGSRLAKLYALAHMDPTPYSFAEDLAELGSTFKYLKGKAFSISKIARDYKKALTQLKRKAKRLKNLNSVEQAKWLANAMSQLWLETRFVLTPLVRSTMDLIEAYDALPSSRPPRMTARGKYEEKANGSGFKVGTVATGLDTTSVWKWNETSDIRAGILYEISNPLHGIRFKYGLRNKDIPITLWNVVRLSFMVDRLVNISASIKAVTNLADPDLKILAAWKTVRSEMTYKFSIDSLEDTRPDPGVWTFNGSPCLDGEFKYTRVEWQPELSDTIPPIHTEGLVADITSTADLIALSISAFR